MSNANLGLRSREKVIPLENIHFSEENRKHLNQLLKEYTHIDILNQYDLPVDNKILLFGHTGCGKTTTAIAIADALGKKLITLNLSSVVSSIV